MAKDDFIPLNPSYTIKQFCTAEGISEPTYYSLKAAGLGPKEMRLHNAAVRISHRAREEWQRARENPTGAEAERVAKQEKKLKARAGRAVAGREARRA
jgi:hypothetical protein